MIGEKLGPFQIEEKIGQGAMGVVYRATYEANGQPVAIKVVAQDQAAKGNSADRFQRESDILKQFRHPNIVLHIGNGFSKSRSLAYYAMEFVPGRTLEAVIEERGAMPWTEVVEQGMQICDALHYAHERGVVHRDLKPSNLLINNEGVIKLTDFGIAKDLDRTALTAAGRTLGTAAYMAPEQIRGTPEVSHKTDLYALGCVLYQMLTGVAPFEGRSAMVLMHKHLEDAPPRPSARNPEIPLALDKLIVRLMAKNREDRPWDAQAVATALAELREKAARKEEVPMVFGNVPANPSRAPGTKASATDSRPSGDDPSPKAHKPRKSKSRRSSETEVSIPRARQFIEIGLLVLALAGLIGVAAYLLWPPSAAYLHRQAAAGMAKSGRGDWVLAKQQYIDELERRFPDHPYQAEVQGWKDRILLEQAKGRARFLENPNALALSEAKGDAEAAYQRTYRAATKDLEAGRDDAALAAWQALAQALKDHPDDRMWLLLTEKHVGELQTAIQSRLQNATSDWLRAEVAARAGQTEQATRLRRELVERYSPFHSLSNLVEKARMAVEAAEAPQPAAPESETAP